eukprot:TRINITY_DN28822_c0_g1_i2.p1 TRINITY_DN28822_c0_g1~~TRINITY_DN28822_c0_g1_i2.p1  ORF type:complete len:243 (+),score=67.37 TRINITY_DN28822_c0_g1_i2:76-804(+)
MVDDYRWKPRTVEDSIDAGVHPAVAALRLKEAGKQRTVNDAIVGKRYHGQSRAAPEVNIDKLSKIDSTFDPSQFFKQANKIGVHPLDFMEKKKGAGPEIPGTGSSKDKKDKKKDKKEKDKKKKKKDKKKKKKKKKKSSSSSSSSSSDSSSSGKKKKAKVSQEEELEAYQMRIAEARQKQAALQELEQAKAQRKAMKEMQARESQMRMAPMRPEEGAAMARQLEQNYFSQFKVMPGKQMPEPT